MLFPIPGIAADGSLYAPHARAAIHPDEALLGRLEKGAAIILGAADTRLRSVAEPLQVRLVEYESDAELMLLRGPAIVEGALGVAIANTEVTLHAAAVGVVGHGNIGRLLSISRTVMALSARVHVFARNPVQRADAFAA